MSNSGYIPRPVFDTLAEVIEQHKTVYDEDNPKQVIRQWLNFCFSGTKVTAPSYASKDYQFSLNFLYSYRGSADTFNAYRMIQKEQLRFIAKGDVCAQNKLINNVFNIAA